MLVGTSLRICSIKKKNYWAKEENSVKTKNSQQYGFYEGDGIKIYSKPVLSPYIVCPQSLIDYE